MAEERNRQRPIQKKVWLNDNEAAYIKRKMEKAGVTTFSNYARKMMMLGTIVKIDLSELMSLKQEINRIGVNINQIAKYVNSSEEVTKEEMAELKSALSEINQLVMVKMKNFKDLEAQLKDIDKEKIEPWLS